MKFKHLLRLFLFVFAVSMTLQAFADSGKFWIGRPGYYWTWPRYQVYYPPRPFNPYYLPPYYYNNWQYMNNQNYSHNYEYSVSLKSNTNASQNTAAQQVTQYQDPRGLVVENFGNGGAGFGIFSEDRQQAVIAWNGRTDASGEEVLILTTNEQINEKLGKSAITLNVVPLPGEPIDILPADSKIIEKAKALMNKKYVATDGSGSGFPAVMHKKIGSHEIFVWRIDEQENFKNAVLTYVKEKFDGKQAIVITKEMEDVINSYFKRGFRYFAFDLSHVEEANTTREAIAYHFKSTFVYFPLVISQVGGMPDTTTTIDMIVMTPGKITMKPITTNKGKVISDENLFVVRKQSVIFTQDEIKELDPSLAKVMKGIPEVSVRNIILQGDLVGFQNDFMATGTK